MEKTAEKDEETSLEFSFDVCSSSLKSCNVECSMNDHPGVDFKRATHSFDSNYVRSFRQDSWKAWNNIRARLTRSY